MDKVKLRWKGEIIEGILLPFERDDVIVIKLNNGYNIGLKREEVEIIEKTTIEKKREERKEEEEGKIAIIGVGGTIASRIDYSTGAVYPSFSAKDLVEEFPEIETFGKIKCKNPFNIFSEDMNPWFWERIAEEIYQELKDGKQGIVVLHGTDTMHYTSAALSFVFQNPPAPIILTGAQRSSDRPSSDNKLNLLNAVFASTLDIGEVGIVMHASINDDYCYLHRGTKVRKMHTSRRDAFQSINIRPLAKLDYRKKEVTWLWERKRRGNKLIYENGFHDNVALVYYYPGMKARFLEKYAEFDGIVIAGTGLGHVAAKNHEKAEDIVSVLKSFVERGIPVVMTSQTLYGRINMNVYSTGRKLKEIGVIGNLLDMLPEVAYVKLSWILKRTRKMEEVRKLMETDIAGEITKRSLLV